MAHEGQRGRKLRVLVANESGRRLSATGISRWLTRVAPPRVRGVVGVALVRDARVRELNRRYRRKDYATDVLSFCAADAPDLKVGPTYGNGSSIAPRRHKPYVGPSFSSGVPNPLPYLGDIVIARGVARRQARQAGHTELTELRVLALHGLLHLLGYDHSRDNGRMARMERALRAKGGLREGLIERATK